jgi:hypothetical protein
MIHGMQLPERHRLLGDLDTERDSTGQSFAKAVEVRYMLSPDNGLLWSICLETQCQHRFAVNGC